MGLSKDFIRGLELVILIWLSEVFLLIGACSRCSLRFWLRCAFWYKAFKWAQE